MTQEKIKRLALSVILVSAAGLAEAQIEEFKLLPADGASYDNFGRSIALDGDTVVIGAFLDDGSAGVDQGSVYVFVRGEMAWIESDKLVPNDAATGDKFGLSAALDQDTLVVGALHADGPAGSDQGSAYVFTRSGNVWTQTAKLLPDNPAAGDEFGISVSISGDTIAVGTRDSGAVYVFSQIGGAWHQEARVAAGDAGAGEFFGQNVHISGDVLIAGAHFDDDGGFNAGAAYVFLRQGTTWLGEAKLVPSGLGAEDHFGISVASHGNTVAVGARHDDDRAPNAGAVYVFSGSGGSWTLDQKLTASDGVSGASFGHSLALYEDQLVAGALFADGGRGAAYLFRRGATGWLEEVKVVASDAAVDDHFGAPVAAGDSRVAAGAIDDDDLGNASGAAYILEFCSFGPSDQPLEFLRGVGPPDTFTVSWQSCGGDGVLTLTNAGASAFVSLNGEQLASPVDLNPTVEDLEIPVLLEAGKNTLELELRGRPSGRITVHLEPTP